MDQCSDQPTTRISAPPASHFAVADTTTARRNSARLNAGRNAYRIAIVALIISVVAPFGEDALLRTLNIHTPMAYRVAETAQEVNRLEQRSADLETQLAAATAQLATYRSRTDAADARLERTLASTRTLALVQLGAVLRRPGPFDLELAVVRSNAAAAPELIPLLTKIAPYAATGVPGNAQLQRDFAVLRARVDSSEHGSMPMAWMTRLIAWPRSALASRSVAPSPSELTDKYVGEAAGEMGRDNLPGAVASVQQVGGVARELLSNWMEDAEARVAIDELARQLNDLVVQQLGAAAGQLADRP